MGTLLTVMMTALITQFGNNIAQEIFKRTKSTIKATAEPVKQEIIKTPVEKETLHIVGFKRYKGGYTAIDNRGMVDPRRGHFPNNF